MIVVLANVVLLMAGVPMATVNTSIALRLIIIFLVTTGFNPNMEIGYMPCELKALNGHLRLDSVTFEHCRSLAITRRCVIYIACQEGLSVFISRRLL